MPTLRVNSGTGKQREGPKAVSFRYWNQQPRHMFFIAASVRAFSALSRSPTRPSSEVGGVLDVADLPAAMGGDILS
jgi:hypothetical protein